MNKNAIKEYAIWARRELIDRVSQKAFEYGIEKDRIEEVKGDTVKGIVLSRREKDARGKLVSEINRKGFDQVMEETAYTWFNRFIALRFMEVNNYLPQKVRPFTDDENKFNPQIINDALDLDFVDKNAIYSYKDANDTDGLYKYLLIALCNDMNQYLPGMFETIDDYRVLLFPDNLLRDGSVVSKLISDIDEDSWNDQVQIIGWLYQFYNTEPKDKVYARKSGTKIKKEEIPAVTQLFTPDWIVKYMTENSLGRLWLDGHPNTEIKKNWKYYLDEAEQEPEVEKQLAEIRLEHSHITPEDIKFIDPCMGSGHILVYAFDVLMQIYTSEGWTERDAAKSILKNNIYGLDIDERAYQLSYFALMMKARQYNRRIFNEGIIPNIMAIEESNEFNRKLLDYFKDLKPLATRVVDIFHDAKEYGSILNVEFKREELDSLQNKLEEIEKKADYGDLLEQAEINTIVSDFEPLLKQAKIMSQKYDVVVTNPPYNPVSNCSAKVQEYAKKHYPDSKTDFFAIFMEKAVSFIEKNAYFGMVNMHSWMFLSSYESLRNKVVNNYVIINMAHLGARAFEEIGGEVVQTAAYVVQKAHVKKYKSKYCRLVEPTTQDGKENLFLQKKCLYVISTESFLTIPGSPIAYWISPNLLKTFNYDCLGKIEYPKQGLSTADNNRFLRLWFEVDRDSLSTNSSSKKNAIDSGAKWFPFSKGGEFRKWYGNFDYIINWANDGEELRSFPNAAIRNSEFYFLRNITWSKVSTGTIAFRLRPEGSVFSDAGCSAVFDDDNVWYALGLLNTKYAHLVFNLINPTINYTQGTIASLPYKIIKDKVSSVNTIVNENIQLCIKDWDSFENSWDFIKHPLVRGENTIKKSYNAWDKECLSRFNQLKANEEELNRIFIDIYGLQDELTPEVDDKDITVRKADLTRDIKSLISYAVGCMFGRYSLDVEGLAYAGGKWDDSNYSSIIPDKDNIIPICDDEYFDDDIVGKFISFIETVYGKETLEENLQFIADALGGKGTPRQIIRSYFLNDFFKDHCNTYQVTGSGKRPIYWQFDSGKKNGFKALIYMHRYSPDLLAKMRTDYVHEMQERYRTQIQNLESHIDALNGSEKVKANKQLAKYKDQLNEISVFEEKLHHLADQMISIDLDDGFKQNYPKFEGVVTKVK